MKIRAGFVSNSSSSSFLVKLPKNFTINPENIHQLMFGTDEESQVEYYGDPVSSRDLAAIVAADLLTALPNDPQKIASELSSEGGPDFEDFMIPISPKDPSKQKENSYGGDKTWDNQSRNKAENAYNKVIMKNYEKTHPDVDTYVIEYSDSSSTGSVLEHSGVLDSIADRFSHH